MTISAAITSWHVRRGMLSEGTYRSRRQRHRWAIITFLAFISITIPSTGEWSGQSRTFTGLDKPAATYYCIEPAATPANRSRFEFVGQANSWQVAAAVQVPVIARRLLLTRPPSLSTINNVIPIEIKVKEALKKVVSVPASVEVPILTPKRRLVSSAKKKGSYQRRKNIRIYVETDKQDWRIAALFPDA